MAYKQSPFPMIKGTSPVKQLGLLLKGIKWGKKAVKFVKKTIKGNPYKGWHPQDIKVDKLATRTNLSKVQFEKKLAKTTKTVDPYPSAKR